MTRVVNNAQAPTNFSFTGSRQKAEDRLRDGGRPTLLLQRKGVTITRRPNYVFNR